MPTQYILTIDDSEAIRGVIDLTLSGQGYSVGHAGSGEEGLQSIKKKTPDLIILDVELPDVTGIQLCQMLKSDPDMRYIPVLMCTSHKTPEQGLKIGADDYITKPFNTAELIERVNALLRRVELAEQHAREKISIEQAPPPPAAEEADPQLAPVSAAPEATGLQPERAPRDPRLPGKSAPAPVPKPFRAGDAPVFVWECLTDPFRSISAVSPAMALLPLALFCLLQVFAGLIDPNASSRVLAVLKGFAGPLVVWACAVVFSLAAFPAQRGADGRVRAASLCAVAAAPLAFRCFLSLAYGLITNGEPSDFSGSPLLLVARIAPNSITGFWAGRLDLFEFWSADLLAQGAVRVADFSPRRASFLGVGAWLLWSLAKAAIYVLVKSR